MNATETLGVLAHPGGLLVNRPELTVGVVRAVSRPSGLEIELLARRPVDRRSAVERQADIRAGRGQQTATHRVLLPAFDEGTDLRVGWLDRNGRARWAYGSLSSDSGDPSQGPSLRTTVNLPPLFDEFSLVLAWPEIGFPETVVRLPLPDRVRVERETVSVWRAPPEESRPASSLNNRVAAVQSREVAIEAGRIVAAPLVLHRGKHAVVVLTRLTEVGSALSIELLSLAKREVAAALLSAMFPPGPPPARLHEDPQEIRGYGPGASVAVVRRNEAFWAPPHEASCTGGGSTFEAVSEFTLTSTGDVLDLVVAWPRAGLDDVRLSVALDGR